MNRNCKLCITVIHFVFEQEATQLSSLKPEFDKAQFNLYGVVHQTFGVDGFQPSFKGEIFKDEEVLEF